MDYTGPSRPGRPRASTRTSITAVALGLFRTNGYHATSVQQIAAQAGISRTTFFNYFVSKEQVLWACQADQLSFLESRLAQSEGDDDAFEVVARTLIEATADISADEATASADHRAVLERSPELGVAAGLLADRRSEVITSFVARRLGLGERDVVPMSYALALDGATRAAGFAFSESRNSLLSDFMYEAISPIYKGFATSRLQH